MRSQRWMAQPRHRLRHLGPERGPMRDVLVPRARRCVVASEDPRVRGCARWREDARGVFDVEKAAEEVHIGARRGARPPSSPDRSRTRRSLLEWSAKRTRHNCWSQRARLSTNLMPGLNCWYSSYFDEARACSTGRWRAMSSFDHSMTLPSRRSAPPVRHRVPTAVRASRSRPRSSRAALEADVVRQRRERGCRRAMRAAPAPRRARRCSPRPWARP